MRTLLVAVAGAVLVEARAVAETDTARRRGGGSPAALERLRRCEALVAGDPPPGGPSTRAPAAPPFPSLSDELALVEEISPSWLGVRFRPVARSVRAARHLPDGANLLDAVFPGSPAEEAGLQAGDIVIGPPGRPFEAGREMREWAMTSPRGTPLPLRVVRPDHEGGADRVLEVALVLRAMPVDLPSLAGPPAVGDRAPLLPSAVVRVGAGGLPDLHGQSHLLFFWATWCAPCKAAVPEVMALARSRNLPVVAISDEDEGTVARFLALRTEAFFTLVAVDPLRASFIAYGVSGTPTMVLVGADGVIHHRQVGYAADEGLSVEGWRWPGR